MSLHCKMSLSERCKKESSISQLQLQNTQSQREVMVLREWEVLQVLTERGYTAPCVAMHNISCHICMLTVCWPACIHSTQ